MQQGKRVRASDLDVRGIASPLDCIRVGLIVPLHGHSAVERNKLKRRLRELVRQELLHQKAAADVVIRCRPSAYMRNYDTLRLQIVRIRETIVEQFGGGGGT